MTNTCSTSQKTPLGLKILAVFALVSLMAGSITGLMTALNHGVSNGFFKLWLQNYLSALVSVVPLGFALMALLSKLAEHYFRQVNEKYRNAVVGLLMALIMESGLAMVSTYNQLGFTNLDAFGALWASTVVKALPFALVFVTLISLSIKPRVERLLRS